MIISVGSYSREWHLLCKDCYGVDLMPKAMPLDLMACRSWEKGGLVLLQGAGVHDGRRQGSAGDLAWTINRSYVGTPFEVMLRPWLHFWSSLLFDEHVSPPDCANMSVIHLLILDMATQMHLQVHACCSLVQAFNHLPDGLHIAMSGHDSKRPEQACMFP